MAFYNFILLAAAFLLTGFLVISARRRLIKKRKLKTIVHMTAIIIIVSITGAVVLFPNFKSVQTTGPYAYASCVLALTDTSRVEAFKTDGSFRKLSVLVYYPFTDELANSACPLIVFSHGGISTKTSNLSLYKELASHGYVVVSIDHTYHALSTEIDGERISIDSGYMNELMNENSHSDMENSYVCFQKWMQLRTGDINFVIDAFIEKSRHDGDSFYRLINPNSIGLAGHSLGGSAALGVARQRNDVKAVMALESPYLCDIVGVDGEAFVWNAEPYACAVLNIYSDSGYPLIETDHKYVQNKNHLRNDETVRYDHLAGSNHYTLTDLVRTSPILCVLLGGRYETSGYQTLAVINQRSLAFFEEFLR